MYIVELPTYEIDLPFIFHFQDFGKATSFMKILIDNGYNATIKRENSR